MPSATIRDVGDPTIEETLRRLEDRAAMIRHLAENTGREPLSKSVLSGVADACEDIVEMAQKIRGGLTADALSAEVKRRRGV